MTMYFDRQIKLISDDIVDLEQEVETLLVSRDDGNLAQIAETSGLYEDYTKIREMIVSLLKEIDGRRAEILEPGDPKLLTDKERAALWDELRQLNDLVMQLNALLGRVETLLDRVDLAAGADQDRSSVTSKVRRGLALLKRWILRISSALWAAIGHLLTPKEWKISGAVKEPVLGLFDVGVEITFGDRP
ncbi:hypothetical protein [uncultured Maritimibacter sp.]|uniref:hypothetical protein n=1 Tax=uncultured Maritimibacter sp. TaxID=991866 RepID=UPI00262818CF|nr:hypothetical protein [uncultured Maritimibacter sp.]